MTGFLQRFEIREEAVANEENLFAQRAERRRKRLGIRAGAGGADAAPGCWILG